MTPAFLFAVFLWQPVRERAAQLEAEGQHPAQAMQHAGSQIIAEQAAVMATPRRFSLPMREIWMLQLRLENKGGRRSVRAWVIHVSVPPMISCCCAQRQAKCPGHWLTGGRSSRKPMQSNASSRPAGRGHASAGGIARGANRRERQNDNPRIYRYRQ